MTEPTAAPYHRFSFEAMTTMFDVLVAHEDKAYAGYAAQAVFREIERLELLLSRHDPTTDVARINRLAPGEYMRVSMEVLNCLEFAARAYVYTDGAFDPAFRSREGGRPSAMDFLIMSSPESAEPDAPAEFLVGIDPAAVEHGFTSAELDMGAIGKGFALDLATMLMDDYSLDNYLLNSGTSAVLARGGGPEGEGWIVGVSGDYRDQTGISTTALHNCAMSGSGTAIKGEHIRIPESGAAAGALCSWAKAGSAAWSDAMSTALMVMARPRAEELFVADPATGDDFSAIVVYPEGHIIHGTW